ncbi:MAG TPA: DUF58 domain-containing protein [Myxococcota bacterium]|nr:DUF58 domain-containing protein [Myxococcota bacterium]
MSLWPDRRLLASLLGATAVAAVAVALPPLVPVAAAAALALAALAVWDAWQLVRHAPLRAERVLPARAFVDQEAWIELRLAHEGAAPLRAGFRDELPSDVAPVEPRADGLVVAPGVPTVVRYAVRPSARGDRALGPVWVFAGSPLGLFRRRAAHADGAVLRVYPDTARLLRAAALDPKRLLAVLGRKPARRRGDGMEFESLRDYVPGDDPRRLDWAASARRARPVVRVHQHERNHAVMIAIDSSRLMAARSAPRARAGAAEGAAPTVARSKLDCAVESTLALTLAALGTGDRVGLAVFDRAVRVWLPPRARRAELGAFVEALRPVRARPVEADYGALLGALAARQRSRALIVLLTDFVEAESARLAEPIAVLARRHRLLLVAIRDPLYAELETPAARGGPAALQRRIVLDDLLHERETALAALRRRGVETLDLFPEAITAPLLNRYLALRYGPER